MQPIWWFYPIHRNTKTVLECFSAIIAAGIWALFHFDLIEIGETKSNFNGGVTLKLNKWQEKLSLCVFDFEVVVENIGKQTQKLDYIKYTVCEKPAPPKTETIGKTGAQEISGDCVSPPIEVKMNETSSWGKLVRYILARKK